MTRVTVYTHTHPQDSWHGDADASEILEGCVVLNATKETPIRWGRDAVNDPKVIIPLQNVNYVRTTVTDA